MGYSPEDHALLVPRFHRNDGRFARAALPRIAALEWSRGLRPHPKVAPATFLVPRKRTRHFHGVEALVAIAYGMSTLWAVGCSSSPPDLAAGNTSSPVATTSASPLRADLTEAERVQGFLNARYLPTDVTYSFRTKFGEMIDCIDFFAQPGVKAMAKKGTPITTLPPPAMQIPLREGNALFDVAFRGQPDDEGRPRACPSGTAPILRITPAQVEAAGGLDAFTRAHAAHNAPLVPAVAGSVAGYAHVVAGFQGGSNITVGTTTMNVFAPAMTSQAVDPHNISQSWMVTGNGFNYAGQTCSSDCTQTVETGWNIDGTLYESNNPSSAHWFILSTNNGYGDGCYTNSGDDCLAWVTTPHATMAPGQTLTAGSPGGATVEMSLYTVWVSGSTPAWEIFLGDPRGGDVLGYYPASQFVGSMQTSAQTYEVGGEVYDTTQNWLIPMGSGAAPAAGFGQAAYHHDYAVYNGGSGYSHDFAMLAPEQPSYYDFSQTAPAGSPSWANYFYYGNMPLVFWGQNANFQFSAVGDWDFGSYKGECPSAGLSAGSPVVGLSMYTSSPNQAHAVQCGPGLGLNAQSACYLRSFNPQDNRGATDNGVDWDPGYPKGECGPGEFVEGVAQTLSGSIDGILCCNSQLFHRSTCTAQVFANGNSPAYQGVDWDPGFYKGECPAGYSVTGVSGSGAPHAIYCCSVN